MIPDPETVLKAGDFIYVLTAAKNAERLQNWPKNSCLKTIYERFEN